MAKCLRDHGIPARLDDHPMEVGDAQQLLADPERFQRNIRSISHRDTLIKRETLIQTRLVSPHPTVNVPGDFDRHVSNCCLAIQAGDYTGSLDAMRRAFSVYGSPVRGVVWECLQMGHLSPPERVALTSVYEWMRLALADKEYEALPKG